MSPGDAYEFINDQDDATVESFANRLEFRAQDATFSRFRDDYLSRLRIPPYGRVLDIGCGTGVLARALLTGQDFAGPIVAVDQSPVLIEAARKYAAQVSGGDRIEFRVGDVHALDLEDDSVDVVIAHTLVSHVRDPLTVLKEAARVVRPGGSVAIFDGDYASWTFGCSDAELGKAMEEAIVAAVVSKPRVMRDMPRLMQAAGLERFDTIGYVYVDVGKGHFFPGAAEAYAPLVVRAGLLPPERVDTWLAEQRQAMASEVFFAACNYYAHLSTRP